MVIRKGVKNMKYKIGDELIFPQGNIISLSQIPVWWKNTWRDVEELPDWWKKKWSHKLKKDLLEVVTVNVVFRSKRPYYACVTKNKIFIKVFDDSDWVRPYKEIERTKQVNVVHDWLSAKV